jgi:hypothetical protein
LEWLDFEWFDIGLSGTLTSFGVQDNTNSVTFIGGIRITTTEGTPFIWSAELFTQTTDLDTPDYNSTEKDFNNPAVNAFDGATGTSASSSASVPTSWLHWRPSSPIRVNSSLRLSSAYTTQQIQVNEVTTGNNSNANGTAEWVNLTPHVSLPLDLSVLSLRGASASTSASGAVSAWLGAVEIDGQILVDGVNNSYGENGFHLTFADPDNLGLDTSGNGNNFTATGFDTAPVGIFAQTAWTGATYSANDVAGLTYNGSTGVITGFVNGVQAGTFTADTGINRVIGWMAPPQNITVMDFNYGQQPFIHQPVGTVALQTQKLPAATIANGRDNFQALTGPGQGSVTSEITAVEVPNEVLVTYNGNSTWTGPTDPSMTGLRAVVGSGSGAGGFDAKYGSGSPGGNGTRYESFFSLTELGTSVPITVGAGGVYVSSQDQCNNGTVGGFSRITVDGGTQWEVPGSPGGYPCNSASGSGQNGGKRGSLKGFVAADNVTSDYPAIPGGTANSGQSGRSGQVLFYELYPEGSSIGTPATDGIILTFTDSTNFADFAKNQSCQNEDGSATGVIASIDAVNSTIILKDTTGTWQVGDSLYTTSGSGSGLLGVAQQTFPNGLWWIKDMVNVNQHQISNSVLPADSWGQCPGNFNAFGAYQAPAGTSVAWCWGGNEVTGADLTAVNANGDLDLTGLVRNVDAGMSSGYYNGSPDGSTQSPGTQLSIPHGLNQAPEFVVVSLMDDNGAHGQQFHRVPLFILTKRSSAIEDWSIVDTTRSPNNPAFQNLRPNQTNGEGGGLDLMTLIF